eukprot:EG_transcript_14877
MDAQPESHPYLVFEVEEDIVIVDELQLSPSNGCIVAEDLCLSSPLFPAGASLDRRFTCTPAAGRPHCLRRSSQFLQRSPTPFPRRRNRSLRLDQDPLTSLPAPEPSAQVGTPHDVEPLGLPDAGYPVQRRAVNGVQLAWHTLDIPKESPRTVLPRRRVIDARACTPGIHQLS